MQLAPACPVMPRAGAASPSAGSASAPAVSLSPSPMLSLPVSLPASASSESLATAAPADIELDRTPRARSRPAFSPGPSPSPSTPAAPSSAASATAPASATPSSAGAALAAALADELGAERRSSAPSSSASSSSAAPTAAADSWYGRPRASTTAAATSPAASAAAAGSAAAATSSSSRAHLPPALQARLRAGSISALGGGGADPARPDATSSVQEADARRRRNRALSDALVASRHARKASSAHASAAAAFATPAPAAAVAALPRAPPPAEPLPPPSASASRSSSRSASRSHSRNTSTSSKRSSSGASAALSSLSSGSGSTGSGTGGNLSAASLQIALLARTLGAESDAKARDDWSSFISNGYSFLHKQAHGLADATALEPPATTSVLPASGSGLPPAMHLSPAVRAATGLQTRSSRSSSVSSSTGSGSAPSISSGSAGSTPPVSPTASLFSPSVRAALLHQHQYPQAAAGAGAGAASPSVLSLASKSSGKSSSASSDTATSTGTARMGGAAALQAAHGQAAGGGGGGGRSRFAAAFASSVTMVMAGRSMSSDSALTHASTASLDSSGSTATSEGSHEALTDREDAVTMAHVGALARQTFGARASKEADPMHTFADSPVFSLHNAKESLAWLSDELAFDEPEAELDLEQAGASVAGDAEDQEDCAYPSSDEGDFDAFFDPHPVRVRRVVSRPRTPQPPAAAAVSTAVEAPPARAPTVASVAKHRISTATSATVSSASGASLRRQSLLSGSSRPSTAGSARSLQTELTQQEEEDENVAFSESDAGEDDMFCDAPSFLSPALGSSYASLGRNNKLLPAAPSRDRDERLLSRLSMDSDGSIDAPSSSAAASSVRAATPSKLLTVPPPGFQPAIRRRGSSLSSAKAKREPVASPAASPQLARTNSTSSRAGAGAESTAPPSPSKRRSSRVHLPSELLGSWLASSSAARGADSPVIAPLPLSGRGSLRFSGPNSEALVSAFAAASLAAPSIADEVAANAPAEEDQYSEIGTDSDGDDDLALPYADDASRVRRPAPARTGSGLSAAAMRRLGITDESMLNRPPSTLLLPNQQAIASMRRPSRPTAQPAPGKRVQGGGSSMTDLRLQPGSEQQRSSGNGPLAPPGANPRASKSFIDLESGKRTSRFGDDLPPVPTLSEADRSRLAGADSPRKDSLTVPSGERPAFWRKLSNVGRKDAAGSAEGADFTLNRKTSSSSFATFLQVPAEGPATIKGGSWSFKKMRKVNNVSDVFA